MPGVDQKESLSIRLKNGPVRTGSGSDLAFAVMVLAAYFTMFSTIQRISVSVLVVIIVLGILYISLGVYGYAYVSQRSGFTLRLAYFICQIFLGILIIYLGGEIGFNAMILLPLAGHSVVILPEMWRYIVNAIIVGLYAAVIRMLTGSWDLVWTNMPIFVAGQLFILVFTQMAVSEEQARHEIQSLVDELEVANRQLRENALQAEDLTISKERNRMAREIHDGLGHHLTALNMQIKAARAVLQTRNDARAGELLANAEALTQKALVDVRQSVSALRESMAHSRPLPELIQAALNAGEASGIATEFKVRGEQRNISPQITLAIFRAAQECMNNTLKHSHARGAQVLLDYTLADTVEFSFCDDGDGSDDIHGGFGLIGMKERVQLLDGDIEFITSKDKGFIVKIRLPG